MKTRDCVECIRNGTVRSAVATVHDSRRCLFYCVEHAVWRLTQTSLMFGGECACEKKK